MFLKTFNQTWRLLQDEVKKFSQETSSCPDLPKELRIRGEGLKSADDALALLAALPLVNESTRNYFQIQTLRNHLSNMAFRYRYQGNWKLVGEILQNADSCSCYRTWNAILAKMTPEDWFGNFVPRILKIIRSLYWKQVYHSVLNDHRPVSYPHRKRGYDDKGSRRLTFHPPLESPREKEVSRMSIYLPPAFAWFGRYL